MNSYKNMFKKIAQALFAFFAVFAIAMPANAQAATFNNDPADLATFRVRNASQNADAYVGWGSSVTANAGDTLNFTIYYHNTGSDAAQNTRVFMTAPSGTSNSFTLAGGVGASNAPQVSNSVTVTINGAQQTLTYIPGTFKWYPTKQAVIDANATTVPPSGQSENSLFASSFANGMNLGTVAAATTPDTFRFHGAVVVSFRVGNAGPVVTAPIASNLSVQNISCTSATLSSTISANGNSNVTAWYEYSTNSSMSGANTTATQSFGTSGGTLSQSISGLSQNTTYFYRVGMTANGVTTYSTVQSFSTSVCQQNTSASNLFAQNISCGAATLSSFVQSNGNSSFTAWYEYSTNSSLSGANSTSVQSFGNTSTTFTQSISGLSQNTTYFYRVNTRGTNGVTVSSQIASFTTASCQVQQNTPSVTTLSATNVGTDQATLNGFVNANGNSTVTVRFDYGQNGNLNLSTPSQTFGNTSTNFNSQVFGLSPNTTYSFRAVATANGQTVYGSTLTFTTGSNVQQTTLPSVTTNNSFSNDTSCTFNGTLTATGSSGTASVWFEYGPNFTFGNRTNSQSFSNGSFSAFVGNLVPNTSYQFRAVAQNSAGTVYGNTLTCVTGQQFVPNANLVTVETRPAAFVAYDSGVLNGAVNVLQGGAQNATVWFDYGRTPAFGSRTLPQTVFVVGNVMTPFSRVALSLAPNTQYYFRAVAQAPNGQLAYGNTLSFVTTSAPAVVTPNYVAPSGPTGFSGVRIEKHGVNLTFPNGAHDCFAARPGDVLEYTVIVKNVNNSTPATALTVRDTLSSYFEFIGASQGGALNGNEIVWNLGTVNAGETRTLNYQVRVRPLAGNTSAENIARVSNGVAKELSSNKVTVILLSVPQATNGVVSTTVVPQDSQAAVATSGATSFLSSFFPETALGWLGLLILIMFIGILIRALV